MLNVIRKFPIEVIIGLDDDTFNEAGRIKSKYKIPLGDSIAVAECITRKGILVTSDHSDFGKVENTEKIMINWFR
jgi:predicted nucleic acid-binding protein